MREVNLSEAVEQLRRGAIVIYPTETFYGLGVDIFQEEAVDKLFQLKGREAAKAISVLAPSKISLQELVSELASKLSKLIDKFMPGPLTLVLPAAAKVPLRLCSEGKIGLRISSHPLAQKLVENFNGPITTTSANPSGQPAATTVAQLKAYFGGREDVCFLSGGDLPPSRGSTVVKVEKESLALIRQGEIPFEELKKDFVGG